MVRGPAPRLVGDPGPTVVGIDPAAERVRLPVGTHVVGPPCPAVSRHPSPLAVGRELVAEIPDGDLGPESVVIVIEVAIAIVAVIIVCHGLWRLGELIPE